MSIPVYDTAARLVDDFLKEDERIKAFAQGVDPAIRPMLEGFEREHQLVDAVALSDPLNELRALSNRASNLPDELMNPSTGHFLASAQNATQPFDSALAAESATARISMDRFSIPSYAVIDSLVAGLRETGLDNVLERYFETPKALSARLAAMENPWLDTLAPQRSVLELSKLIGIGSVLERFPPFSEQVTKSLRADLGDWSGPLAWSDELLSDVGKRPKLYADAGFDLRLTAFPAPVFQEGINLTGLRPEPIRLEDRYGAPVSLSLDEEEGADLTNEAHGILYRLEKVIRNRINSLMTMKFGDDWTKRRLPDGMREQWSKKKAKAEGAGALLCLLIEYADFTDYEKIILRKDNWRDVFAVYFRRPTNVQESFSRLYPVRLDTMHARPVSQDDMLLLYVEARRISKAFE